MTFFTCVSKEYVELTKLYIYCVKRAYPDEEVIVSKEPRNTSCQRFLKEVEGEYVHITDADIFILPHEKTHQEYYSQFAFQGASYLRGATEGGGKSWKGDYARIAGGHLGFTPEFYEATREVRADFSKGPFEAYREFDEVMLCRILRASGYPIPEKPYRFFNGAQWDWEYRDLHLNDFLAFKYLKWQPHRGKVKELITEPEFISLSKELSSYWRMLIHKIGEYVN